METERISIQVAEADLAALNSWDWENEQSSRTSEPITIKGLVGGEERGILNASLIVIREVDMDSGKFVETARTVNLGDIGVQPKPRKSGLGGQMESELVRIARRFGATEISGKVTEEDVKASPWLLAFYQKRGYETMEKGSGWVIRKSLD